MEKLSADEDQSKTPGWQYTPEVASSSSASPAKGEKTISWTASEFIAHQKTLGWYVLLGLGGAAAAALVFFVTRDIASAVVIIIVVILLGALAARKPRTLEYRIDAQGIHIGQKDHPYSDFKCFSVIDEDALSSISLLPLGRFKPTLSMYYDPKDEHYIAGILSGYLPYEEGKKDAIDRFMHRIRF